MSQRILVTGAAGFIARHAVAALAAAGGEVHGVCRNAVEGEADRVRWHRADLLDGAARRAVIRDAKPDIVLHAAWETAHGRFWQSPSNLDWVAATLEMAREAAEAGARRFVGVGTCFEYGGAVTGDCIERDTPADPLTLYASAKDSCRRSLEALSVEACLSFAWARIFLLYGPGEAPARLVPHVAQNLLAGRPAPISSGTALRDFIDCRDAGGALATLVLSPVAGPVNVASGQATSVREVALTLGRLAGRPELVKIGALPDRDEPARLVADVTRLREEVGFRAVRPLEQGLAEALDYWRAKSRETAASA